MDLQIKKEIEALKGDIESTNLTLKGYQYSLERQMKEEIGTDIEAYFTPPTPPKKENLFRWVLKKLRRKRI